MKKWALYLSLVALLATMASCALLTELFEGEVITTSDNVAEGREGEAIPITEDILASLPDDVRERLEESGKDLVILPKESVKDPAAPAVELVPEGGSSTLGQITSLALGVAGQVWPGVAALEGLGLLFSRRKRKHYGAALKAATPVDGSVEVGSAITSLVRAMGFAHTSQATKDVAEEESTPKTAKAA